MALAERDVGTSLGASVEEFRRAALAVAVVGSHTVTHLTVALHGDATYTTGNEEVGEFEVGGQRRPCLSLVDEDVVVVAELVAYLHFLGLGTVVHVVEYL